MPSLVLSKLDKDGASEYFKNLQKEENSRMADQYHQMLKTKTPSDIVIKPKEKEQKEKEKKEKKTLSAAEKHIQKV